MSRNCKLMPEIHNAVVSFLQQVIAMHEKGGGTVPLDNFVYALSPNFAQYLGSHSDLSLQRKDDHSDSFSASGQEETFKHDMVTVKVPAVIAGTYISVPNSITFQFDDANTIMGSALFFKAKLIEVDANQYKLDVDLTGDAFDQCIIHAPPNSGSQVNGH